MIPTPQPCGHMRVETYEIVGSSHRSGCLTSISSKRDQGYISWSLERKPWMTCRVRMAHSSLPGCFDESPCFQVFFSPTFLYSSHRLMTDVHRNDPHVMIYPHRPLALCDVTTYRACQATRSACPASFELHPWS